MAIRILLILAVALSGRCIGQQSSTASAANPIADEPRQPTVSVDVKVVNVLATVRDKHGKVVSNLNKDDFTLAEDSQPVAIQYFSRETDLPLTLGLLVDTSMSQRSVLDQERSASKSFVDKVLRDEDTAFLIHFDREVELLQDLTSSRAKLEEALESLHTPSPYEQDNSPDAGGQTGGDEPRRGGGRERGMHRGGTTLYDSIYLAADELMKKQKGRKAVIVLSDGVDRGSKESLESAIESAQRSDTIVYSVFFKGEEPFGNHRGFSYPGRGPMGGGGPVGGGDRHAGSGRYPEEERVDGKKILGRISRQTGGRMFEATKKQSLEQIYSSIEEELRNQYNLGFTPGKSDTAGYHKLTLTAKPKDTEVQAREGFYLEQ